MSNWYENPSIAALVTVWKIKNGDTYQEVVKKLRELGYNTTQSSIKNMLLNWGCQAEVEAPTAKPFEEIYHEVNAALGITDLKYKVPKKSKQELYLVTSDFHSPFHREDMVRHIIMSYGLKSKSPAKQLIINADLFDCYSISKYIKYQSVSLIDEFNSTIALVKILAENFPEIILTLGNHEERVFKYFSQKGIPSEYMFLVNYNWGRHLETLFPNVKVAKEIIGSRIIGEHEASHFHVIGKDCAVGHFEFSGAKTLNAASKFAQWANQWEHHVPQLKDIKLFLHSHTHKLGLYALKGGSVVIGETGCFCKLQEYAVKPDGKYSPSVNGWWEVWQDKGITDLNRSRHYIWE